MSQTPTETSRGFSAVIHWMLRVSAAACFIGHGVMGFATQETWVRFFSIFYIPRELGQDIMPLVGIVDIVVGLSVLILPTRLALFYMVVWASLTALLRPITGLGFFEFLRLAGNYTAPLVLLWMSAGKESREASLIKRGLSLVRPQAMSPDLAKGLGAILTVSTGMILIGNGIAAGINLDETVALRYSSSGVIPGGLEIADFLRLSGVAELVLGVLILFRPWFSLVFLACVWRIVTEVLFPPAGISFWEMIAGSTSYCVPLALALLMLANSNWKFIDFWHCLAVSSFFPKFHPAKLQRFVYLLFFSLALCFFAGVKLALPNSSSYNRPVGLVRASKVRLRAGEPLLKRLQRGGLVFYQNHFQTGEDKLLDDLKSFDHGKLEIVDFRDCEWQKPLSSYGKSTAKLAGEVFRDLNIKVDKLVSSPYCRCIESAELFLGQEPKLFKNLVYNKNEFTRERMEHYTWSLMYTKAGENIFLVGHSAAMAIFGEMEEGESYVFEPTGSGLVLIAKIKAGEWIAAGVDPYFLGREEYTAPDVNFGR